MCPKLYALCHTNTTLFVRHELSWQLQGLHPAFALLVHGERELDAKVRQLAPRLPFVHVSDGLVQQSRNGLSEVDRPELLVLNLQRAAPARLARRGVDPL